MSAVTISQTAASGFPTATETVESGVAFTRRSVSIQVESVQLIASESLGRTARLPARSKVVRRLQGFLVEEQGAESKVAFVENEQLISYYLPTDRLRKNGISVQNQPFEMDEFEIQMEDGSMAVGYGFRPLAKPSDAFVDSIDLNEDLQRKRDLIFKKFGKAKN